MRSLEDIARENYARLDEKGRAIARAYGNGSWADCHRVGRDHDLVLIQTTPWANYYGCGLCPVVIRKEVDRWKLERLATSS